MPFPISLHPKIQEQVVNRWTSRMLVLLVLLALAASTADAQRRSRRRAAATTPGPEYGAHIGYDFDGDDVLLGAQLAWPITPHLDFYPTFDIYFDNGATPWALNFDLKYRPPTRYRAWYVGGGLNLLHGSGNTDTNLDLFTGLEARSGRTHPYVEGRFILASSTIFQLVAGLSWH
ncbi:MAG TPA: hypothetical protein VGU74_05045 [Gemmatimonadales bacterium]|nr:hypothetical protein [Gemmatimonadales bacterium]